MSHFLARAVLTVLSFSLAATVFSQAPSLELVPQANELGDCPGEELTVTIRLRNPGRVEVGGFQLGLRYPAEYLAALRYVPIASHTTLATNGRPPFGPGFVDCLLGEDDWDDGAESDVAFVVGGFLDEKTGLGLTDASLDLGRFVLRALGKPAAAGVVKLSVDVEPCLSIVDSRASLYDARGRALAATLPAPVDLVLLDRGPYVEGFRCADQGALILLEWSRVAEGAVIGYRIFRNSSQIAQFTIPDQFNFQDADFTGDLAVYEIAVLLSGLREGCRASCTLERNPPFTRGDVDRDGNISITDAVLILERLFRGGSIRCDDAADFNDDGIVNLTDAVNLLAYRFQGGREPPPPFPANGRDPTIDQLGCRD